MSIRRAAVFYSAGERTLSVIAARCQIPRGGASGAPGKFLIAPDTLATGLTACALSVKACGFDSSPKGRAKSTAVKLLIALKTLATSFTAWLSLWESWRGSA